MSWSVPLSERCKKIDASGIRKVFDLAAKRKAQGADLVDFSIGQPDFSVPEVIKDAAVEAIRKDLNSYTVTQGIEPLRAKISQQHQQRFGFSPESVMITSGVSGGLVLLFLATCETGDEVIVIDPYFVMYKHLVSMAGAKTVAVSSYPDFKLPLEKIEAAITPRTKVLILNSPTNPTGCVYTEEELKAAAELARKHNLLIVSDEIYRELSYDGPVASVVRYAPERTVLLDGYSKNLALTGWRLGYATGPKAVIEQMLKLQQYTFVCAPSFAQYATAEAIDACDISGHVAEYRKRRNVIYNGLKELNFEVVRPSGGFYIFPKAPGGDAGAFVEKALAKDVLIIPGNVFSDQNTHFRICYTKDEATLRKGLARLREIV
ncbi:MAG: aminotransferase class I/II-fold pyridoxal phosphate-dependent enzyme [Phycisphaerae bacterium]|nr:aminotransferase class I/II-fold pyridoxal phosphate-dependent enzyme [Phycisphaerae bacterium]